MTNIIVAFSKPDDGKNIKNILVKNGYQAVTICSSGAQTVSCADGLNSGIVVSGFKFADMRCEELYDCLPENFKMLLLASQDKISECTNCDIITLSMPLKVHDLIETVNMIESSVILQRRKRRMQPRQRSAEDEKILSEAKDLLMYRNNMTEKEAHRYIQKCSMDSGTDLIETAMMVISLNTM